MRVLVMFDLPTRTAKDRKEYTKFRRFLIKSGFLMLQESVYCKLAVNSAMGEAIVNNVRRNKPEAGTVQVLRITEKQYSKMEWIVGDCCTEVVNTDERLIFL